MSYLDLEDYTPRKFILPNGEVRYYCNPAEQRKVKEEHAKILKDQYDNKLESLDNLIIEIKNFIPKLSKDFPTACEIGLVYTFLKEDLMSQDRFRVFVDSGYEMSFCSYHINILDNPKYL